MFLKGNFLIGLVLGMVAYYMYNKGKERRADRKVAEIEQALTSFFKTNPQVMAQGQSPEKMASDIVNSGGMTTGSYTGSFK